MKKIKCLPGSVHSSLRASVFLFDITRVVEELVLNSLDAGATEVNVGVNVGASYVKVEDNGFGVTRDGLALLGERYVTSKLRNRCGMDDHGGQLGSRGEALSSLSDISLLEVVTRARGRPNAYRKVMKGQNCLFLGIEESRQNVGTTVIVRDLFYNQPVRRKSMQASPKKVLLSVKKCLLQAALVHPKVSFNLIDLQSENELFHTVPSSSPLPLVSSYFGSEVSSCLREVSYSDKHLDLNGFLSGPAGTGFVKAFQYLYINSRFVCRGPVHNLINSLASSFPMSLEHSRSEPEVHDMKRQRTQGYPVYMLNLLCPLSSYDLTFEPSKTVVEFKDWTFVLSFIEQAVWNSWEGTSARSFLGISFDDLTYEHSVELLQEDCGVRHDQRNGGLYETTADIIFFQRETNFGHQVDSYKRKAFDSRRISDFSRDEMIFPENKAHLFASDSSFLGGSYLLSDLIRRSCEKGDYPIMGKELVKNDEEDLNNELTGSKSTCHSYENKSHVRNVPFLSRCGHSLDIYGKQFFSTESPPESMEKFSARRVPGIRFNKGNNVSPCRPFTLGALNHSESSRSIRDTMERTDQFRGSFDLMGAGIEKKEPDRLWTDYRICEDNLGQYRPEETDICLNAKHVMENTLSSLLSDSEPVHGSTGSLSSLLLPADDLAWISGQRNSKSFNVSGKFQALPTVNCNDDALCLNPERTVYDQHTSKEIKSRKVVPGEVNGEHFWIKFNLQATDNKSNCNMYTHDLPGQKSNQRGRTNTDEIKNCEFSHLENIRRRSHSAPPFYKSKRKLSLHIQCPNDATALSEADEMEYSNSDTIKWRTRDSLHFSGSNRAQKHSSYDDILDISSGMLHLAGNSLVPESVSRDTLQDAKVLLQVDRKFIPATAGDVLIAIDQHAADERIRLEELRKKVMSGEGCSITYLDSQQELVLPEIGFQLVQNYGDQIKKWGWICSSHVSSEGSFARNLGLLKKKSCSITLLAVPCILGINLSDKDLLEYLEQLADTDGTSSMPPSVLRVLNFKACRGAIMFGDPLLPSECSLIVDELKETSLCFQCAHGRPTTVPLVNLAELHKHLAKLRLHAAGRMTPWHRLRQHRPSVERAQARLSSAKRFHNG
ncbi:unnamed protein product [Spirodela intermedia]|uniref:Uncharacterized protein n=1 Tax=Spirodela intermedia TaxID=51605 RepID=A0A7I8L6E0_SPIIN|nr:unnamed protein product [Spirodela intermedia]